jgi:uncharacterized protein YbjT (DUF2867 family)
MRILIFGATGMVGQGVLRECLLDARVTEVVTVARSPLGKQDRKLTELALPDVFGIAEIADRLTGFDACFFCLGVSSVGMSEADYTRITYDLTLTAGRVLASRNPAMIFIYVTGAGTSRDSRQMWSRVKARTEDALGALPFRAAYFFRPGFIQPLHGVVSKTRWYMAIYALIRPLSPTLVKVFPRLATTTERVGQAMINVSVAGYQTPVLESADINIASSGG